MQAEAVTGDRRLVLTSLHEGVSSKASTPSGNSVSTCASEGAGKRGPASDSRGIWAHLRKGLETAMDGKPGARTRRATKMSKKPFIVTDALNLEVPRNVGRCGALVGEIMAATAVVALQDGGEGLTPELVAHLVVLIEGAIQEQTFHSELSAAIGLIAMNRPELLTSDLVAKLKGLLQNGVASGCCETATNVVHAIRHLARKRPSLLTLELVLTATRLALKADAELRKDALRMAHLIAKHCPWLVTQEFADAVHCSMEAKETPSKALRPPEPLAQAFVTP